MWKWKNIEKNLQKLPDSLKKKICEYVINSGFE